MKQEANQTARVANLMAKPQPFAFRLAALNAMGGEQASYPYSKQKAKALGQQVSRRKAFVNYYGRLER